ncbi:hypothetical protein INH39_30470 [Massilia violaceinigra]|uniref:DUF4124 domain-containing protein n=1 Tax=Massilia violaceinigra TaxID=2045208 RepID=A0ABY4A5J7_9BURK|nr:hypothetical protein [Massilia violaceinigra]UOD29662.1 hypothetical protein INH39_30470 [Massilia violaceinigra]
MALSGAVARLACLLLAASTMPSAQAALFKYVDPVTRVASYTNFRPSQRGARELVLRELVLRREAAPRRVAPPGEPRPVALASSSPRAAVAVVGPASFPRIDARRQRELDSDRKYILGTELMSAQADLARLLAGSAPADSIGRRRSDVAALERELARVR